MAHCNQPVVNVAPLSPSDVQADNEEQEVPRQDCSELLQSIHLFPQADELTSTLVLSQDHYGFFKDCDEGQMN